MTPPLMKIFSKASTLFILLSNCTSTTESQPVKQPVTIEKIENDIDQMQKLMEEYGNEATSDKTEVNEQITKCSEKIADFIANILKNNIYFYKNNDKLSKEDIKKKLTDINSADFVDEASEKIKEAHEKGKNFINDVYNTFMNIFSEKEKELIAKFLKEDKMFAKSQAAGLFTKFENAKGQKEAFKYDDFLKEVTPLLEDFASISKNSTDLSKHILEKSNNAFNVLMLYAAVDVVLAIICIYLIASILKTRRNKIDEPVLNESASMNSESNQ